MQRPRLALRTELATRGGSSRSGIRAGARRNTLACSLRPPASVSRARSVRCSAYRLPTVSPSSTATILRPGPGRGRPARGAVVAETSPSPGELTGDASFRELLKGAAVHHVVVGVSCDRRGRQRAGPATNLAGPER